jgi:hypothetical protein
MAHRYRVVVLLAVALSGALPVPPTAAALAGKARIRTCKTVAKACTAGQGDLNLVVSVTIEPGTQGRRSGPTGSRR